MAQMIEEEAGKDLSGNYPWSEALLERLKDKVSYLVIAVSTTIKVVNFAKVVNFITFAKRFCL